MTKHFRPRAVVAPALTFLIGLATGALVFSDEVNEIDRRVEPVQSPASASASAPAGAVDLALKVNAGAGRALVEPGPALAGPSEARDAEVVQQTLVARLDELAQGWGQMRAELAVLRRQVAELEHQSRLAADAAGADDAAGPASRPRTPLEQREALVQAGVDFATADAVLQRRSQMELDRLELRDRAQREGWLGSEQYREALRELNAGRTSLRDEIGVQAYDRYLFATGQDNRVSVDSVIAGSAGDLNGLLPGDVIESYADRPVLDLGDLREATSDGIRDELVPVEVRRDGQMVEVWLPRGPIGIRVEPARLEPRG